MRRVSKPIRGATIEELRKIGYRYKDIAILFRSVRTLAPPLIEVLEKRGTPFRRAGRRGEA